MADDTDSADVGADPGSLRDGFRSSAGWIMLGVALLTVFAVTALRVLAPLIFGIFLYYGTRPIHRHLRHYGVPNRAAATTALLAIGLPVLVITLLIVVTAVNQAIILANQGGLSQLRPLIQELGIQTAQLSQYTSVQDFLASQSFRDVLTGSWSALSNITNTMVGFLFTVLLSFTAAFFMYGWGRGARKEAVALFDDRTGLLEQFLDELDGDLAEVFYGNMLLAVVTSILGAVAYTALNTFSGAELAVPAPILLGLLTGVASFVPMVGSKIVYVPITLILLFKSFTSGMAAGYGFSLLFLAVAFLIVDTLPDIFLRPLISGRTTSQGALFIAYLVGPLVFGFVGIFLMPIIVVVFINFRRIVLPGFKRTG